MLRSFILILTTCFVMGCTINFDQKTEVEAEIVIGGLLDMTGSASDYGRVLKKAADLRVDQWNKAGGIREGRTVRIKWENGNCNDRVAEQATYQLLEEENVAVIIGGVCSDETLGAARVTEANKVILISPTASSSKISQAGEYIFRTNASSVSQADVLARHAFDKKYKKIGILFEKTGYTNDLVNVFKDIYTGEVFELEVFPESENMAIDQIKELASRDVDSILVISQSSDTVYKAVSQMHSLNWEGGIMFDQVGVEDPDIIIDFKDYLTERQAVGALYFLKTGTHNIEEFKQQYYDEYSEELNYSNFVASMLDSVDVILEVLNYAEDETNVEEIANILYSTQHVGYTGVVSFDENGDLRAGYSLVEFDGEEFQKVRK